MDLKQLLGEELYNQVIAKAGDNKLAIVSDGNWFPKDKFDAVNNDNKELKKQLKDRDDQLKELGEKAKGHDDLTQQIKDLQDANKKTAKEYEDKLQKQAFEFALEKSLSEAKAKNPKAVKALLDTSTIKLDGDKLLGLEEQLKSLQESDGYLFAEDAPGLAGRKPHVPGTPNPNAYQGKNPFSKDHFNLTEQAKLFKENPDLYKQLKAQA